MDVVIGGGPLRVRGGGGEEIEIMIFMIWIAVEYVIPGRFGARERWKQSFGGLAEDLRPGGIFYWTDVKRRVNF